MTIRLILAVIGLTGVGFLGLPQAGFAETKPLTNNADLASDMSEGTAFDDRTSQFGVVLSDKDAAPTAIAPIADDSRSKSSSGVGSDMASIIENVPENAGLDDPSRVAEPPQSPLRQFLSALIQLGLASR